MAGILTAALAAALLAPSMAHSQSQEPVNLGSTANFAVLAASLISNVPTSAITGDIGLSPATGGNITGFSPASQVTGKIYTVDASGPAGSTQDATRLTKAQGDLTIAYNDASGRTPVPTGPFLNPGSGNIGGLTLVPGLYKFTSGAAITGSNVTLTGSATDVWIFQIATTLNVGNGIQVTLAGGAQASNIFWQVGTSATLGTTSVTQGTIMANQSISMNTGATLNGRALASIAAVTLASNVITRPPTVTSVGGLVLTGGTTPVSGAKVVLILAGVRIDSVVSSASGAYLFHSSADSILLAKDTTGSKQVQASKAFLVTTTASAPSANVNVNLALAAGAGNVNGVVTQTNSTAIQGAKVVLKLGSAAVDSVLTDSLGRYSFSNTAAANYSLTASAATFLTAVTPLSLNANASLSLNIALSPLVLGTITGSVKSAADTVLAISGALVTLYQGSSTGTFVDSTRTNVSGVYTFPGLTPASQNYWITVSASGYASASTPGTTGIAVGNGAVVTSNFLMSVPGSITGTLTNIFSVSSGGEPMHNVPVVLRRGSGTSLVLDSTVTNSNGIYTFTGLAPGAPYYWITALSTIGTQTNDSVAVTAGAATTSNFTFNQTSAILPNLANLANSHGIRFITAGNQLELELGLSSSTRTVSIFSLSGSLEREVFIPAGETQVLVPATFAPSRGFLFKMN